MGAILGLCTLAGGQLREDEWAAAVARAREFGRDGFAEWRGDRVALGRAVNRVRERAAPSTAGLPDELGVKAVASVRLDNRPELLAALDLPPRVTDTALIVAGWKRWGVRLPARLHGDFAFALWDERARQLFLARDRGGLRPLFYHEAPDRLAFASAPSILGELVPDRLRLDPMSWSALFLRQSGNPRDTPWLGVRRLLPGTSLLLQPGDPVATVERYRDPPTPGVPRSSVQEAVEEARDTFDRVVLSQSAESAAGLMLSGGLDSSWLAATLARVRGADRLTCVGSVLPLHHVGEETDERGPQALLEAALPGLDVAHVESVAGDPLALLDGFRATGVMLNAFHRMDDALFASLARRGARTVFTGFGGDSTLSYHGAGWLRSSWQAIGLPACLGLLQRVARFRGRSAARELGAELRRWLPPVMQRAPRGAARMLSPALLARLDRGHRDALAGDFVRSLASKAGDGFTVAEELALVAARHGAELALPFLAPEVIALCLRVPRAGFVAGGRPRGLAREAMRGQVPDALRLRPEKQPYWPGFGAAVRSCWATYRSELEALNGRSPDRFAQWLDAGRLQQMFAAGPPPGTGWGREHGLLAVAQTVAAWRFLESAGEFGG